MTSTLPETDKESTNSPTAPPIYRGGRRDLGLGLVIGVAASVVLLLPALVSAFSGGEIFPDLAESGATVVLVLVGIVIAIWAVVDGIPAWRNRTPRARAEVAK